MAWNGNYAYFRKGLLFQRGPSPKRGCARTGTDAHAVLGHAVEIDQALLQQRGYAMGEQVIQKLDVLDTEVRQRVIMDRDAATDPAKAVVVAAQPVQSPGTADPFHGGQQPQGHQDLGIDGRTSWPARSGANRLQE